MQKIHMNKNITYQLTKDKVHDQRILMILFNTQMIWMLLLKILKDIVEIRNIKN